MHNEEAAGCRALVISIFKQAINDAVLVRNPFYRKLMQEKAKKVVVKKLKRKKKVINFYTLRKEFIFAVTHYNLFDDRKLKLSKIIVKMIDKICGDESIEAMSNINKSLDARSFLNINNKEFCYYMNLIGIEPSYGYAKIDKGIRMFDRGEKNIFKKSFLGC